MDARANDSSIASASGWRSPLAAPPREDMKNGGGGGQQHVRAVAATSTSTSSSTMSLRAANGGGDGGDGGDGDDDHGAASFASSSTTSQTPLEKLVYVFMTFAKFIGPGFMISVAYIDPGNYSTDISAGASYRYKLLFIVFLSNLFAVVLQTLSIQLGTVTGMDLASACRAYLPRWLNWFLYALAEIAIIATDLAEVIGTAIALNLLIPKLPLVAGCALSILDVMLLLIFYRPDGAMKGLRAFEFFVLALVVGVVVCFCIQLSLIRDTSVVEVFKGFIPSSDLVQSNAIYQACGILGATVMPHSLYLGSGIVQPRLREYDEKHNLLPQGPMSAASSTIDDGYDKMVYIPSLAAMRHCLKYSITELVVALFTFALFVNSAILIVAGASLYGNADALTADIFGIHQLLSDSISPAAAFIFALALLLSGVSAGIVCTIAGQMVSEGALRWKVKPWVRRLITRSISITPAIIVAAAVGRDGIDATLNASQVVLSTVLPFTTLPLIYFTARARYMTVRPGMAQLHLESDGQGNFMGYAGVDMSNGWVMIIVAALIWLAMTVMNVANLVYLGLGTQ